MRRSPTVFASAIALALSASSCAPRNSTGDADTVGRSGGVVVVTGRQLLSRGGNLLDALRGRVSNMRIERQQGRCPVIALRGQKTIVGSTNPNIYIDGTRMTDTCSLDQVQLVSVDRVEIYSGGISPPAGYSPAANGVIIVFLTGPPVRRGERAADQPTTSNTVSVVAVARLVSSVTITRRR